MERQIEPPKSYKPISAGGAYWNQRRALAENRKRILDLFGAVGSRSDLSLFQWSQLLAMTLEYQPDLVVELGRGRGNSTCVFTEAMNLLGTRGGYVISLCLSVDWEERTRTEVAKCVPPDWFDPLAAVKQDILAFDFQPILQHAKRCLLFWDAHGFDIAECALGKILPLIAGKEHLVVMHDLSDARYASDAHRFYGTNGLWKGNSWSGPRLQIGHIDSSVEQAVAVVDFSSRNRIALHSADESLQDEIGADPKRLKEMQDLLGDEIFSLHAYWYYFTLNERADLYTFPVPPNGERSERNVGRSDTGSRQSGNGA